MSSECEYRHCAVRFDRARHGLKEDLLVLSVLMGSSNVFAASGARTRRWHVASIGTFDEAMAGSIRNAGACEGGSLCVGSFGQSGAMTPERYIARLRKILTNASDPALTDVRLELRVTVSDHLIGRMDPHRVALLHELAASDVRCARSTAFGTLGGTTGDGAYKNLPCRRWEFDGPLEVALFERFRSLDDNPWPSSRAFGPGEV